MWSDMGIKSCNGRLCDETREKGFLVSERGRAEREHKKRWADGDESRQSGIWVVFGRSVSLRLIGDDWR